MKILLTAFDPFGSDVVNPALEAVKLVDTSLVDAEVVKLEVPTIFHRSIEVVAEAMEKERPDAVLAIGQAGGRFNLTPERVATDRCTCLRRWRGCIFQFAADQGDGTSHARCRAPRTGLEYGRNLRL